MADASPDLPIAEAGRRLRDGRLTSLALTLAHLARRIDELNPTYNAFYVVLTERALDDARRADAELAAGQDRGPLHGIPIALKDLIDVAGVPTTAGSKSRANAVAERNAEVTQRLIDGGAVILGKLATYEWGTVGPAFDTLFPPAANPWNLRTASLAVHRLAVRRRWRVGLIRTSIGTDTGGSLQRPRCLLRRR